MASILYENMDLPKLKISRQLENTNDLGVVDISQVGYSYKEEEEGFPQLDKTLKDKLGEIVQDIENLQESLNTLSPEELGVPAKAATYYTSVEEYNTAKKEEDPNFVELTQEQFELLPQDSKIKTEAVTATGLFARLSDLNSAVAQSQTYALAAGASQAVATSVYEQAQRYITRLNTELNNALETLNSTQQTASETIRTNVDKIDTLSEIATNLQIAFNAVSEDPSIIESIPFEVLSLEAFGNLDQNGEIDSTRLYFCYEDTENEDDYVLITAAPDPISQYGYVSGGGYYKVNDNVTLLAHPNSTHTFTQWVNQSGETISTENPYTFSIEVNQESSTYYARFAENTEYKKVSVISSNLEMGDIKIVDGNTQVYSKEVESGATIDIVVTLNNKNYYKFIKLYNNSGEILSGSLINDLDPNNENQVIVHYEYSTTISDDVTYCAMFDNNEYLHLTLSTSPTYAGEILGGDTYKIGDTAIIKVVNSEPQWFTFKQWNDDSTDEVKLIQNLQTDKVLTAYFDYSGLSETNSSEPEGKSTSLSLTKTTSDSSAQEVTFNYYYFVHEYGQTASFYAKSFNVEVTENTNIFPKIVTGIKEINDDLGNNNTLTYYINYKIKQQITPTQLRFTLLQNNVQQDQGKLTTTNDTIDDYVGLQISSNTYYVSNTLVPNDNVIYVLKTLQENELVDSLLSVKIYEIVSKQFTAKDSTQETTFGTGTFEFTGTTLNDYSQIQISSYTETTANNDLQNEAIFWIPSQYSESDPITVYSYDGEIFEDSSIRFILASE